MHGDSKVDNFMFKSVSRSYTVDGPDDVYNAVIVDWQVLIRNIIDRVTDKKLDSYNI